MSAFGIDVSSIQAANVDRPGIAFTVVKATEGRTYTNPDHTAQVATARAAGHVVGHYHYLWPGHIDEQAAYFVRQAAAQPGDFLACDWETASSAGAASSAEKDQFIRAVQRLAPGVKVVLYCNRDFWVNRDKSRFAGDGLWIADPDHAPGRPNVSAPWLIHQYGQDGVDLDVFNGSAEQLRAWAGANGTPRPSAPPTSTGWPTYTVVPGDNLSTIAARHGVSLSMLEDANPQISNPDRIFPGQVLQLPAAGSAPAPAPAPRRTYVVRPGDNLSQIAQAHRVTLAALEQANPKISNPDLIFPGQEINLP
ncbi:GH25 family lysozyme [Kitasatospora sp. NPDC057198]|uniref:GH25 family lysozyme n=1 Tax=Kitasatospora sp. NPDC057198 TaxID=3346046 RepID=UPI00364144D6